MTASTRLVPARQFERQTGGMAGSGRLTNAYVVLENQADIPVYAY